MAEATEGKGSKTKQAQEAETSESTSQECFVIMPISDQPGYQPGHFTHVYRDIIKPACISAGLTPYRADENSGTNIIQHEILIQLLNTPVAICDLSSRNPNVMFELGLRQAFDKPVILIQDELTPPVFDISMLRYATYRSTRLYNEVIEDQERIKSAINSTLKDKTEGRSANSLMKLLSMDKAVLDNPSREDITSYTINSIKNQIDFIVDELSMIRNERRLEIPLRISRRDYDLDNSLKHKEEFIVKHLNLMSQLEIDSLLQQLPKELATITNARLIAGNTSDSVFIKAYGGGLKSISAVYKRELDVLLSVMKEISPELFDYRNHKP